MGDETWTSWLHSSDREYFVAPLPEISKLPTQLLPARGFQNAFFCQQFLGPRHFSHFHLSCVDFYKPSYTTPLVFWKSQKINRIVLIMSLLERIKNGEFAETRFSLY